MLAAILLMMPACSSGPGKLIARQEFNHPASVQEAPKNGAYGLFIDGDDHPIFTYRLSQGDKLGFELSEGATINSMQVQWLYAIFGDQRFRLSADKSYEWRWLYDVPAAGAK